MRPVRVVSICECICDRLLFVLSLIPRPVGVAVRDRLPSLPDLELLPFLAFNWARRCDSTLERKSSYFVL